MENIKQHPKFSNYGYDVNLNQIVYIPTKREVKQIVSNNGYCLCSLSNNDISKSCLCHRFIWECYNDIIARGYEIDHIDKNKTNNNISNLRCITLQENRKNRDHTNIIKNAKLAHRMKRFIKAINVETKEIFCFNCKNQCGKFFSISPAMIYLIVEKKNYTNTANTNKGKFIFEYIDEKDVENLIIIPHGRLGKIYKTKQI